VAVFTLTELRRTLVSYTAPYFSIVVCKGLFSRVFTVECRVHAALGNWNTRGGTKNLQYIGPFFAQICSGFSLNKTYFLSAKQSKHYVTEFHIFVFLLVFFSAKLSLFCCKSMYCVIFKKIQLSWNKRYAWHLDWQHNYCLLFSTGEWLHSWLYAQSLFKLLLNKSEDDSLNIGEEMAEKSPFWKVDFSPIFLNKGWKSNLFSTWENNYVNAYWNLKQTAHV